MCVSCQRIFPFDKLDAGHYFTVAHSKVRFSEQNVWAQCQGCNRFQADYSKPYYAANLLRKLGMEAFNQLEQDSREIVTWKRKWLEEKIKEYKTKRLNDF